MVSTISSCAAYREASSALLGIPDHGARALASDVRALLGAVGARLGLRQRRHRQVLAERHVQPAQVDHLREPLRLLAGWRADDEATEQRVRGRAAPRLEALLVRAHHCVAALRVDEVREREVQAELRGERSAVVGRAEQPDLGRGLAAGLHAHALVRMILGQRAVEVPDQFPDALREVVRARELPARYGVRGARVAPGRAANSEVHAPRVEGLQHAEHLGHLEGAVVGQQHPAAADAHALRFCAQAREQHLGAGVGERGDGMVLGEPVAVIAERLGMARELESRLDGLRRGAAGEHRGLVEDGEFQGHPALSRPGCKPRAGCFDPGHGPQPRPWRSGPPRGGRLRPEPAHRPRSCRP
jgi:hypothetical protein